MNRSKNSLPREVQQARESRFMRAAAYTIAAVGTAIADTYLSVVEHISGTETAGLAGAAALAGIFAATELIEAGDIRARAEARPNHDL